MDRAVQIFPLAAAVNVGFTDENELVERSWAETIPAGIEIPGRYGLR